MELGVGGEGVGVGEVDAAGAVEGEPSGVQGRAGGLAVVGGGSIQRQGGGNRDAGIGAGVDDGREVGEVTSGTVSPSLGHPVMLAYVERLALDDAPIRPLHANVRGRRLAVQPTPLPFMPKRYKR